MSEGAVVEKEELLEELLLERAPGLKLNKGRGCIPGAFSRLRLYESTRCERDDRIFLKVRGG